MPEQPVAIWGWGWIPDQYGRRSFDDDEKRGVRSAQAAEHALADHGAAEQHEREVQLGVDARSGFAVGGGCAARRRCAPRPSAPCQAPSRARCRAGRSRASRHAIAELATVLVVVIATVGEHPLGSPARSSPLAGDRSDAVDQRQQLRDVVAVPAGQADRERYARESR